MVIVCAVQLWRGPSQAVVIAGFEHWISSIRLHDRKADQQGRRRLKISIRRGTTEQCESVQAWLPPWNSGLSSSGVAWASSRTAH